jgi:hypothetical protein
MKKKLLKTRTQAMKTKNNNKKILPINHIEVFKKRLFIWRRMIWKYLFYKRLILMTIIVFIIIK